MVNHRGGERQKRWCEGYQRLVNRQGRTITVMLQCVPVEVVVQEAGLRPAVLLLNNRQWRYILRFLAAPKTHPARDILPVTIRDGEDQEQSEAQQEDNNACTSLSIAEQEHLGQRLARALIAKTDIEAGKDTEYT